MQSGPFGTLLVAGSIGWLAAFAVVYPDEPPPAHTGGFGEPTCVACHFDAPVNDPAGMLVVEGMPAHVEPGRAYEFTIRIAHPEMQRWGFQLAARHPSGAQAGRFDTTAVGVVVDRQDGVEYVRHSPAHTAPDSTRWTIRWHAPDSGRVLLHLAVNAGNGDESAFGDYVYTWEGRTEAP